MGGNTPPQGGGEGGRGITVKAGEHLQIVREQIGEPSVCAKIKGTQDITIEENASASYVEVILPSGNGECLRSAFTVHLAGAGASFKSDVAYMAVGRAGQDGGCTGSVINIDHTVHHTAPNTNCLMHAAGSIAPYSQKMYRGTIDFHKGCTGSKGNETEDVLMLTASSGQEKRPVNRSLPIILCDEEDVEGEHGSTIGQLDESTLFYCQSRGMGESEAVSMICRAKVERVASLIEDDSTRESVQRKIDEWFESFANKRGEDVKR